MYIINSISRFLPKDMFESAVVDGEPDTETTASSRVIPSI